MARMFTADRARRAFTLAELLLWIVLAGLTAGLGIHQLRRHLDRLATRAAISEAGALVARARDEAVAQHAPVSLLIDSAAVAIELRARGTRIALHRLGGAGGLVLSASRDSIAFDVRGLGYGAANLTLVARRGDAADTLVVSRLGRVRY